MTTEALAETPSAEELAKRDEALVSGALANIDAGELQLPRLKVGQQGTTEVADGKAKSGDFINSVTGKSYGDETEFITVYYYKGRLFADDASGQTYSAHDQDVAPDNWPDQFAGKPFKDIPEAEEQHKARANDPDDDFQWGSGPEIQTTHNFIGFIPGEALPVRLSLKGTSTPAADKIKTLMNFAGKSPWASSVKLATKLKGDKQPYYVVTATLGEQSTPDLIAQAQDLAQQVQDAEKITSADGDEDDTPAKPGKAETPKGGVDL